MSIDDQIKSLTKNEMTVLYWKCRGLNYEQIRLRLTYSKDWVQLQMSTAYAKLGFEKSMHWTQRTDILQKEVCPRLPKEIKDWEPEEITEENKVEIIETRADPEMMALVLYDEQQIEAEKGKSLTPPRPKEPIIINGEKEDKWKTFRQVFFAIVSFIVLLSITYFAYISGRGATPAPEIIVITATFPPLTDTALPTLTSVIPTDTPFPTVSPTQVPTNTLIPTEFVPPADGVLFQDNFDGSMSPEWTQISGTWIIENNRLTKLPYTGSGWTYETLFLNRPEWKNFTVSLDIERPNGNDWDEVVVVVGRKGPELLGIQIEDYIFWGFIDLGNYQGTSPLTGDREYTADLSMNVEISVNNGVYSFGSNGRTYQTINLQGYYSEGIMIGVDCSNTLKGCTRIDNIKVTYLP